MIYKKYSHCSNVNFLGFVNHDNLTKLYNESDVFIFPTLGEGYGLVVLEAMSCGLPVICSSNAGGNDAIIDGYNGFVFDAGDNEDMKKKIEWFIENNNEINKMGLNARRTAEKYTWDEYYKNIINELNNINLNNR